MSVFEFLMVLVSLIVGLGIAELLSGIARAIRNRNTIKLYWVHSLFVAIVFLALLQQWWEIWGLSTNEVWTFVGLLMMLGAPIGLFLISHLLFPEQMENANLKSYYFDKMKPGLWIAVGTVVIASSFRPIVFGHNYFSIDNLSSIVLMIIFASMAFFRNQYFQAVMVIIILALLLMDIFFYGAQIAQQ